MNHKIGKGKFFRTNVYREILTSFSKVIKKFFLLKTKVKGIKMFKIINDLKTIIPADFIKHGPETTY